MDKNVTFNSLEEYAELDGTEWGEAMMLLCSLQGHRAYLSTELLIALQQEIDTNLANVKENATVTTTTEYYSHQVKHLDWN